MARRLRRCYLAGPVAQHHLASLARNPVTQPFDDGGSRKDRDENQNIEGISLHNSWTLYNFMRTLSSLVNISFSKPGM